MPVSAQRQPAGLPKLRELDILPVQTAGHRQLLLSDPLQLSDRQILVPLELAPILGFLDGEHDLDALTALANALLERKLTREQIGILIDQLDEVILLENESFELAYRAALQDYQQAEARPAMLAGAAYPAEPDACKRALDSYLAQSGLPARAASIRGLISPHIDYARGWQTYAASWSAAAPAVQQATLAIILGTDHYATNGALTLTRQSYATPYGVLPTATRQVEALARTLHPVDPFEGELRHRGEHSIELAAVWLHHVRGGQPIELLPLLCGDIQRFAAGRADELVGFLEMLKQVVRQQRTIVIAAADLSHVGPAFGDGALDESARRQLARKDDRLMQVIEAGSPAGFLDRMTRDGNPTRVCGAGPIYLALEALAPLRAERLAYQSCDAGADGLSAVTVCGHLLF